MPRETFEYEINTFGNNISVHTIEIEGSQDGRDEILQGRDPNNPNVFKGDIKDVLVVDDFIRVKAAAYGDAFVGWELTIKHNGKSITDKPLEFVISNLGTIFPQGTLKWKK